jgi:branched-subunit amino acid ABC-type transport system permease component
LCGVGGVLIAIQIGSFSYSTWEQFLPLVIAAAIVGGVGRTGGAVAGALLIGLVTALASALLSSAYEDVIALGILIAVLLLRPQGCSVSVPSSHQLASERCFPFGLLPDEQRLHGRNRFRAEASR